jgi:hypothetical protein
MIGVSLVPPCEGDRVVPSLTTGDLIEPAAVSKNEENSIEILRQPREPKIATRRDMHGMQQVSKSSAGKALSARAPGNLYRRRPFSF